MCTYKILIANLAVFIIVMAVFFVDAFSGLPFWKLLVCGMLHTVWIGVLYVLVNLLLNRSAFKYMLEMLWSRKKQ